MATVTVPQRPRWIAIRGTGFNCGSCHSKRIASAKPKGKKAVPISLKAPCRESDHTQCRDGTANANGSARPSRAFCEVMLKVLNRDNQLRRTYVQRCWQGLLERSATAAMHARKVGLPER